MSKLWIRLGCKIELTDKEIQNLKENPEETLNNLFNSNRFTLEGDSYFPYCEENADILGGEEDYTIEI